MQVGVRVGAHQLSGADLLLDVESNGNEPQFLSQERHDTAAAGLGIRPGGSDCSPLERTNVNV
eukprot:scaffold1528_cov117-Isochrysis_galbana.AAC.3